MSDKNNEINYAGFFQKHLRAMVKDLLETVEKDGLPGNNHFFINFMTDHPDIILSDTLKAKYPKEMTIVLQNRFRGLQVEEKGFKISLAFSGIWDNMYIPFGAISQFVDPYAGFFVPLEPDQYEPVLSSKTLTLVSPVDDHELSEKSPDTDGVSTDEVLEKKNKPEVDNRIPKSKIKKKDNLVFVDFSKED